MQRLFDYFVIVGFDYDHERTGRNFGRILQRFPEKDWSDTAFNPAITHFCQPRGWRLIHEYESPTFMVSVLTSIDATRQFCACLSFLESIKIDNSENWYDERNSDRNFVANLDHFGCPNSPAYAPKCLVITSRFDFFEIFRNCLGILYSSYVDPCPDIKLEVLVGNMLGNVYVPPPGCPAVRFSLGSFDRQTVQAPLNPNIPSTGVSVYSFFEELGINNALLVFSAAICEAKIIFVSRSYCKLTEACKALEALFYPLRYSHVFIPVLPLDMLEILDAPTPYMIGVHTDHLPHIHFTDGLLINLDVSSVEFRPPSFSIPTISDSHKGIIVSSLLLILKPYVISADQAFVLKSENGDSEYLRTKDEMFKDKCIRAVFLRFFAHIFSGYRSCLLVVRINPKPVIKFHKPKFLGLKKIVNDEFINKLFDSMSFQKFVEERGPPFRVCDLFDQLCSSACLTNQSDNIKEIANNLLRNEPNLMPHTNRIPAPNFRKPAFAFPYLNVDLVSSTIKEGIKKQEQIKIVSTNQAHQPVFVDMGPPLEPSISSKSDWQHTRRLEIIKKCISMIFSDKISEAKKMMGAVVHALKYYESARLPFCEELSSYAKQNGSCLTDAQFELILQLLNSALESESPFDEHGVAYMMLTLATTFHRRLNNEMTQFSYTEIQNHAVWSCFKFWELAFYSDVQIQIVNLYASKFPEFENHACRYVDDIDSHNCSHFIESVLKLTASHISTPKTIEQMNLLSRIEEQTVSSLVLHFIQRIVYMKIPLRKNPLRRASRTTGSDITGVDNIGFVDRWSLESGIDCDSFDAVSESVIVFARRFVERVCDEGGVCEGTQSDLLAKLYQTVQIQLEELEKISKEVGKDICCPKPELLRLRLIPENTEHEECLSMRAFLVSDGRDDPLFDSSLSLFPAEGSLSLTNYRIIFKGRSVDPRITNEYTLIRWFPIHSLIKEKKISGPYRLQGSNICLYNGLQLRSATFQLIKVFFDDEVDISDIEKFRTRTNEKRYPECIYQMFCFSESIEGKDQNLKNKDRTLRNYAKSMLKRTGFANGREKTRESRLMPGRSLKFLDSEFFDSHRYNSDDEDRKMIMQDSDTITYSSLYDTKSFNGFFDSCVYKDYCRLRLISNSSFKNISNTLNNSEKFKISHVNRVYGLCQTYPAAFVMPKGVSDDSIKRFSRCYKLNRFPVIVWKHLETNALLLRSSSFSGKSFISVLIKGAQTNSNSSSETNASIEHEKYLDTIVRLTPRTIPFVDETFDELPEFTPLLLRRSEAKTFSKFSEYVSKQSQERLKWRSNAKDDTLPSRYAYTDNSSSCHDSVCLVSDFDIGENTLHVYKRHPLYIICERSQYKINKLDQNQSYTLLPVDIHEARHVRASFRKLLRACVPSSCPTTDSNEKHDANREKSHLFLKLVEESQWHQQIQRILFISNRVVEFMEDHASSVILSLENGWDITAQISSTVQILSDPYYRTIEGFQTLIEREWLAFGHKFTHRCHQIMNSRFSFAPLFLQFLDVVHQILNQFPTFFEFNEYFLKFLAYHHLSGRFKNFTLDSECERLISRNWKPNSSSFPKQVRSVQDIYCFTTINIWEFINRIHRYLPIFYNFMYLPVKSSKALRPSWKSWSLDIWDYYCHEALSCGSVYDLDLKHLEVTEQIEDVDSIIGNRSFISLAFDEADGNLLDEINYLFNEYSKLELKSSCLPSWQSLWEKLEQPERNKFTNFETLNKNKFKYKVHQFTRRYVDERCVCDGCREVISYGCLVLICRCCRISCHLACENIAGKVCTKVNTIANCSLHQAGSVSDTFDCKPNFTNITYRTVSQHKTFEGLLKKRGHLLKQWKERWFVLDSVRHELRYYDSLEDIQVRGVIYLAEAVEVTRVSSPVAGVPKRTDMSTFFDLKTSKRIYNFIAPSVQQANEWIEKLQACLDC